MNTVIVSLIAFVGFAFGIFVYSRWIEKLLGVDPNEKTPAYTEADGVDYVPAKNWLVLFGHHFSSIAGAAPIVGPVIAVSIWGWSPVLLWVVLGSVLIGGLHDFSALVISMKNKGRSIADISEDVISKRARLLFSLFVFFALILVVAVFAYLCSKTIVTDTRIVFPSLGLIPVAILVGILMYRIKFNQIASTLIGLALLSGLIVISTYISPNLIGGTLNVWLVVLLVYAFIASITPVNILLQPRDYLSAYLLFFGVISGYLGIFITHPTMNAPFYVSGSSSQAYLWPMLFVTVACGALSGFHSLIASGTTSKQISNQRYARRIGYGAMILEGALAVLALICVGAGLKDFTSFKEIMSTSGPISAFSKGFGTLTEPLLAGFGAMIGVVILNAFILTTLDTATRITRYIFEELTSIKNRWISTGIVIVLAGFLAWGGRWRTIWPTFGASNQLVATLALFVTACWLLSKNKPFRIALIPGILMLATTLTALGLQILKYFHSKQYLLLGISVLLIILACYVLMEVIRVLMKRKIFNNL